MTIKFKDSDAAPITDVAGLSCTPSYVSFTDGTKWQSASTLGSILAQPNAPVRITECSVTNVDPWDPKYNLFAHLSFINVSSAPLAAIKFGINFYDAFDAKLGTLYGTVRGTFAPHVEIDPLRGGVNNDFLYSPSSPAWRYYFGPGSPSNASIAPDDIASSQCFVSEVRGRDGSIWQAALLSAGSDH